MDSLRHTFCKKERLTNKTLINLLFSEGKGFVEPPFRIVWREAKLKTKFPAQVAISVSKRNFKKAVNRNLLKRRIREIYRQNKHMLYKDLQGKEIQIAFMIVYLSKNILSTADMQAQLKIALQRIPKEHEKHEKNSVILKNNDPLPNDPAD